MLKIIICVALILAVKCDRWQAVGNFTADNLTDIVSIFEKAITDVLSGVKPGDGLAKNISTELNTKWDPAWNVFVVSVTDQTLDSVVYGYAFNNHWLWYNNKFGSGLCFIVWKDYNCQIWMDYKSALGGTFSTEITTALQTRLVNLMTANPSYYFDIWRVAYQSSAPLDLKMMAFSTVVVPTNNVIIGRFCTAAENQQGLYFSSKISKNSTYSLTIITLGMRAIVS